MLLSWRPQKVSLGTSQLRAQRDNRSITQHNRKLKRNFAKLVKIFFVRVCSFLFLRFITQPIIGSRHTKGTTIFNSDFVFSHKQTHWPSSSPPRKKEKKKYILSSSTGMRFVYFPNTVTKLWAPYRSKLCYFTKLPRLAYIFSTFNKKKRWYVHLAVRICCALSETLFFFHFRYLCTKGAQVDVGPKPSCREQQSRTVVHKQKIAPLRTRSTEINKRKSKTKKKERRG